MSKAVGSTRGRDHALVLGGSIAGLLAARVLAERFARVTVVERDPLPRDAEPRKGVPQGRHVHVLLARGQQIVERWFPDLLATLPSDGLVGADTGEQFFWHHFGCWKTRFRSGIRMLFVYRPHFEAEVARRVLALPNVDMIAGAEARGLLADGEGRRVVGARVARSTEGGGTEDIAADLVVDATGRGSQTPQWLRELGLPAPRESEVEIHVGYSSRIYRFQPEPRPWQSLFVVPRPPDTRAAAVFPIGPDRWVVTLAGWLADYPPVDPDGYLGFARSLPVPEVAAALEGASPLTSAVPHRFPSSRRRHYERLRPAPEGLVVMGDALCSFNPVYGQGMTLATLHAQALEESLGRAGTTPADLCRRYHRLAAKASDVPWQLATGEDFRYAKAKGRRPFGTRWVNAYVGRVHLAASSDPAVAQAFFRVLHLLSPPALLFRPDIPFRLLRHALRGSAERE